MILSGADVRQYIKHGGLKFSPELRDDQFQQNGIDMVIDSVEDALLGAGQFTLGRTAETVKMPNDLMGFVQLRSTWGRHGFIMPGTVIDAGFYGTVTLELAWFRRPGEATGYKRVPVGQRFAHVIFAKLSTPSAPYAGKYQGQQAITRAIED